MRDGDILPIEIMARREEWSLGISIYLRQQTVGQGSMIAQPVTFERMTSDLGVIQQPMLHLEIQQAQQLMDELWQCGLRPSEGTGSAGAMAAVQKHLEDMRRLVFDEPSPKTRIQEG